MSESVENGSKEIIDEDKPKEIPHYLKGFEDTKVIADGDTVIIHEKFDSMKLMKVESGKSIQNRFGLFELNDIVGKRFGSRIVSRKGDTHVVIMEPTPHLVTETLSHKTQILYSMDIAMILLVLNIGPGSNVIESGTGSCSLSCSILNALQNEGHLYTFEYNEDRANNAKTVFETFKFENCSVFHQDVYSNGFGEIPEEITAVFLDLPKPWLAIPFAKQKMVSGSRICCFSPCIEQVMNNTKTMADLGFLDIFTKEVLLREFKKFPQKKKRKVIDDAGKEKIVEYQVQLYSSGVNTQKGHTGYLTFAYLP